MRLEDEVVEAVYNIEKLGRKYGVKVAFSGPGSIPKLVVRSDKPIPARVAKRIREVAPCCEISIESQIQSA